MLLLSQKKFELDSCPSAAEAEKRKKNNNQNKWSNR